jgi:pyrimidine operon attenuation protein/uracil phosphoribosyltransferase
MMQKSFRIAGARDVDRLIARLAGQLTVQLADEFCLVGIRRRGAPLARMLSDRLAQRSGAAVSLRELTLKRYDDDLRVLHEEPALEDEDMPLPVAGKTVVLVDDVFYTGRTLLRAAHFALKQGARRVHCAVLCARDAPEVPIRADFVGLRLDVGSGNIVDVEVPPYEPESGIVLRHHD